MNFGCASKLFEVFRQASFLIAKLDLLRATMACTGASRLLWLQHVENSMFGTSAKQTMNFQAVRGVDPRLVPVCSPALRICS